MRGAAMSTWNRGRAFSLLAASVVAAGVAAGASAEAAVVRVALGVDAGRRAAAPDNQIAATGVEIAGRALVGRRALRDHAGPLDAALHRGALHAAAAAVVGVDAQIEARRPAAAA